MRKSFVALLIVLGGCSSPAPPNNAVAPKKLPPPTAMFGGVDLLKPVEASGTAPLDWKLALAPGEITYTVSPARRAAPEPWYPVGVIIEGAKASYATHDTSQRKTLVTLTPEPCRQHGQSFPLTAVLDIDGKILRGCAGPKPAEPPHK